MVSLTIGTLAKQAGVGVETVRFYERQGLIQKPPRPECVNHFETPNALI